MSFVLSNADLSQSATRTQTSVVRQRSVWLQCGPHLVIEARIVTGDASRCATLDNAHIVGAVGFSLAQNTVDSRRPKIVPSIVLTTDPSLDCTQHSKLIVHIRKIRHFSGLLSAVNKVVSSPSNIG